MFQINVPVSVPNNMLNGQAPVTISELSTETDENSNRNVVKFGLWLQKVNFKNGQADRRSINYQLNEFRCLLFK